MYRLGVAIMVIQIAANSYRATGSIFGHDIIDIMFKPDKFIDCMFMDFVMCFSTMLWCVPLHKAITKGTIRWRGAGWLLHSVCTPRTGGIVLTFLDLGSKPPRRRDLLHT